MPITGSDVALMYAQSGVMRAGASRSNYTSKLVFLSIDAVHYATGRSATAQCVYEQLSITQNLNDDPDTCTFKARGFTPLNGQPVVVTLGSKNNLDRLFGGIVMRATHGYVGTPANDNTSVTCTDWTWMLTRKKVNGRWLSTSATDIALELLADVPAGFTTYGVEAGLDTVDEFTVTNTTIIDALRRLAKRIGGYVDVDPHKDVKFGVSDQSGTNPVDLTSANTSLDALTIDRDMSQMITRVFVEGGGVSALTFVEAGETILPVQNVDWYIEAGGMVACGPQRLTYTGAVAPEGGSVVGPGASPGSAPAAAVTPGSGITAGTHLYAYTFVTGSGESLPSPTVSMATYTLTGPAAGPTVNQVVTFYGTTAYTAGDTVDRKVTYSTATNASDFTRESVPSAATTVTAVAPGSSGGTANADQVLLAASSDTSVQLVRLWRQVNGGGYFHIVSYGNIPGNVTSVVDDSFPSATALPAGSGTFAQAALTGIAVGPSGTTSRQVYRTAAGGSQLKLLTTLADNTTTVYADSTADGSLGADAPVVDASGLTQPSGQVTAGATTLPLAGAGAFSDDGGWVIIGNGQQVVRYTGIDENDLTGIPASGPGAITATIGYNSSATPAPSLVGIPSSGTGAILYDITGGDPVNLLVQLDDLDAQLYVHTHIGGAEDGVIEEYLQDNRLSAEEARLRGLALLDTRNTVTDTITWKSRDHNTRAGRTVTLDVTDPIVMDEPFKIQSVTISDFWPALSPTFTASGSDRRFTFEDYLRQEREK